MGGGAVGDVSAVQAALWPDGEAAEPGEAYAVLDGARERRVEWHVRLSGLEHACLYGEAVGRDLRNAAPFLVRLERRTPQTEGLIEVMWGRAWGVFAVAPHGTGMERMRRHCRRLLRVLGPDGGVLLFRWYDPRVLHLFLPTCTAEQAAEFYGPVRRFVLEAGDGSPVVVRAQTPEGG